jgi:hypothetical protein
MRAPASADLESTEAGKRGSTMTLSSAFQKCGPCLAVLWGCRHWVDCGSTPDKRPKSPYQQLCAPLPSLPAPDARCLGYVHCACGRLHWDEVARADRGCTRAGDGMPSKQDMFLLAGNRTPPRSCWSGQGGSVAAWVCVIIHLQMHSFTPRRSGLCIEQHIVPCRRLPFPMLPMECTSLIERVFDGMLHSSFGTHHMPSLPRSGPAGRCGSPACPECEWRQYRMLSALDSSAAFCCR